MSAIVRGRVTADHRGEIVVFIIGMRINRVLAIGTWMPVLRAMPAMLRELAADPDSGFLHSEFLFKSPRMPVLVQYWRSFDALHRYANDPARVHQPAWAAFNRAAKQGDAVGIFHETYVVRGGASETVYGNMPPFGLAAATGHGPATGSRAGARGRLERS